MNLIEVRSDEFFAQFVRLAEDERHLQPGVVPAAGHGGATGRETYQYDHGYIESLRCGAKLLFYAKGKVAKSRAAARAQVVVIVRRRETQLSFRGDTKAD